MRLGVPAIRPLYAPKDLDKLLKPSSIAVVGASEAPGSFGGQVLRNLMGSSVRAYAVNPRGGSVHGVAAATELGELAEVADLVAVCVGADRVAGVLDRAAELGISNAVVFASGFADAGTAEGDARQAEIALIAQSGLRVLGPNCLGFIDFHRRTEVHFVRGFGAAIRPGGLGVVAQSGALGFLLTQAQYRGAGFSRWIAPGNSVDVDVLDAVNYLIEDPETDAIVLVIESLARGQLLNELGAKAAAADKPIIVHKMGYSAIGGRAAATHTGAIAGSEAVFTQAFRDAGFIVVPHFDELLEVAELFVKSGRRPRRDGRGVGVLSASGGAAIIAADEAETYGVALPELSQDTVAALRALLPGFGSVANPTDLTGEAAKDPRMFEECLQVFKHDPSFDLIMAPLTIAWEATTAPRAEALAHAAQSSPDGAALAAIWLSDWADGPGGRALRESSRVATFRSFRVAMTAARLWLDWGSRAVTPPSGLDVEITHETQIDTARAVLDAIPGTGSGDQTLDEWESRRVLAALGLPTTAPTILPLADEPAAQAVLESLSYPVVVKLRSREITHKASAGGVAVNLANVAEAMEAARDMQAKFSAPGLVAEVLVEPMIRGVREWFVGARRDPAFGTVLTIGRGGTDVEQHEPILIVAATSETDVLTAVQQQAVGEQPSTWPAAVAAQLAQIGGLLLELFAAVPSLAEVDINPLIETSDGLRGVDGVILLAGS
jgi:acetate---CoA ligase (ADP-forming)